MFYKMEYANPQIISQVPNNKYVSRLKKREKTQIQVYLMERHQGSCIEKIMIRSAWITAWHLTDNLKAKNKFLDTPNPDTFLLNFFKIQ